MTSAPAKAALPHCSAALSSALKQHFGFDTFRPGQEAIVTDVLAGRDVLAIMPTGGGKSLCFQLPAVLRSGLTIVVSPLIALMQDQVRLLEEQGIAATFINSTLSAAQIGARIAAAAAGEFKLLYLAPERLLHPEFLRTALPDLVSSRGVSAIVIDEAHCVSEWGHDFRPEYRQLAGVRQRFAAIPILAFTATATIRVREDIVRQLALREPKIHVASFNRSNLFYSVRPKNKRSYREILERCKQRASSGIVYCLSRKRVDELTASLRADGIAALPYHAGLTAQERTHNQDAFINDDAQVIVATIAFGMGINKPDVRWVVHFDLPRTLESYYQESGRAGRDGDAADCVLYFGAGDIRTAEFLIQQKVDPATGEALVDEQRIARQQLRQVANYAQSSECRRAIQLSYFGESFSPPCAACDNCTSKRRLVDRTVEAQQFLSCVARLAQRREHFGISYIIDVLRGSQSQRVIDNGHTSLSGYGIGKTMSLDQWRTLARTLVHKGYVRQSDDGYAVLTLNEKSWEIMRGEQTVEIAATAVDERQSIPRAPKDDDARFGLHAGATTIDERLFESLRAVRKQIATQHGVPPYIIFHDATLKRIAERKPTTHDAFASISGVGETKLARYADPFIEAVRQHLATSST